MSPSEALWYYQSRVIPTVRYTPEQIYENSRIAHPLFEQTYAKIENVQDC